MGTGMGTHYSTRTTSHGHSTETKLEAPVGEAGAEVSTPSLGYRFLIRLMLLSMLCHGFPCHFRAGPQQGPQASWSCQSSSGCDYSVPAQLRTGMLVYLEQQIFLLMAVGAGLSRRKDRAQVCSTKTQNVKCYFSLLGGKF